MKWKFAMPNLYMDWDVMTAYGYYYLEAKHLPESEHAFYEEAKSTRNQITVSLRWDS